MSYGKQLRDDDISDAANMLSGGGYPQMAMRLLDNPESKVVWNALIGGVIAKNSPKLAKCVLRLLGHEPS